MLASSFVNIFAPDSMLSVWSTDGRINFSLHTASLRGERSTQIRISSLDFFGATTMPEHHSVGCSIRLMTPSCSMRWSSCFTFPIKGSGTRRRTFKDTGLASGLSEIVYCCCTKPNPPHSFGYCCFTCFYIFESKSILSTLATSLRLTEAGLLSRAVFKCFTT